MHSFLTSIFIWTKAEVFSRIFFKILQLSTLFILCLSSMSWVKFLLNTQHFIEINYFWHNIQYFYYIMELSSYNIVLLAKQRKFDFFFFFIYWSMFVTVILKDKIVFVRKHNLHIFCWFYLNFPLYYLIAHTAKILKHAWNNKRYHISKC